MLSPVAANGEAELMLILSCSKSLFQLFHYIENDGASVVVHENGEEPFGKARQMQTRKFTAASKAMIVNCTFIVLKEMAGHFIDDH